MEMLLDMAHTEKELFRDTNHDAGTHTSKHQSPCTAVVKPIIADDNVSSEVKLNRAQKNVGQPANYKSVHFKV